MPISLIVWMVVNQIQGVALAPQSVITPSGTSPDSFSRKPATTSGQEENINRCWA